MKVPRKELDERILALAVQLRALLTGEDVVLMKRFGDSIRRPSSSEAAIEPHDPRTAITDTEKILEVSKRMIQCLTGEVSVRCQDVAVFLSMEEREYLEEHQDLYKEAMMEEESCLQSYGHCEDGTVHGAHHPLSPISEENVRELTARALTLTMEIITRLASENYLFVQGMKQSGPPGTSSPRNHQSSILKSPPLSLMQRNAEKILQVSRKITELLTAEVPVRHQDVSVYFSMEERKYLEDHKALYKEVMEEEQTVLTNIGEQEYLDDQDFSMEDNMEDQQIHKDINMEDDPCPRSLDSPLYDNVVTRDEDQILKSKNTNQPLNSAPQNKNQTMNSALQNTNLLTNPTPLVMKEPAGRFQCAMCMKRFPSNTALICHRKNHRMQNLTCSKCGKEFQKLMGFEDLEGEIENLVCGNCCKLEGELEEPEDRAEFSCEKCEKTFKTQPALSAHMKRTHEPKLFKCPECPRICSCSSTLAAHIRVHTGEKPHECSECGARFGISANLQAHLRIHTGEKPFRCSECSKTFRYHSHLKAHQRLHTGQTLPCPECGLVFVYNSHLLIHQRLHTGERPYSCAECGESFLRNFQLQRHIVTHTGKPSFKCDECGKAFLSNPSLKRHQMSHMRQDCSQTSALDGAAKPKVFRCSECDKCYTRNTSLMEHQMTHTGERPFSCPVCGMGFLKRRYMERHRQTRHGPKDVSLC